MTVYSLDGVAPELPADGDAWIAPGAQVIGRVILRAGASVWFNAVLRAEQEPIVIGEGSNLQDNVSCHVDAGFPLTVGRNVSVGHGAVLHGCTVEDDCLIGMSSTVLNGAVIGAGSLVAAGAVVLEVERGSDAARAGVEAADLLRDGRVRPGHVVVALDGEPVATLDDLLALLDRHAVGDRVEATFDTGGSRTETLELTVEAGS